MSYITIPDEWSNHNEFESDNTMHSDAYHVGFVALRTDVEKNQASLTLVQQKLDFC